jgi:hypothetical protein
MWKQVLSAQKSCFACRYWPEINGVGEGLKDTFPVNHLLVLLKPLLRWSNLIEINVLVIKAW